MKIGTQIHLERSVDEILDEARTADDQGFDSVWMSDHIMAIYGRPHEADGPLDLFLLMTAVAAVTKRVRLAWGTLNTTLRPPLLFAKMLTTLDVISHGRVICTMGSGWNLDEWKLYNLPLVEDHDQRAEYSRELIVLYKQMWTHPAPELTYFDGKYVQVKGLPFNPQPVQRPYPPIWIGGESEATLKTAREECDGWMPLATGGNPERLREILTAPDWPTDREMTVVKSARIVVRRTREEALAAALREYEAGKVATPNQFNVPFEEWVAREVVGSPEDCLKRIDTFASWGANYLRVSFPNDESQEACAKLLLPRLEEAIQPVSSR